MRKIFLFLSVLTTIAFAIQSLVVSSAMITEQLTVPFLIPAVTVAAGWITLILIIIGILVLIFRALSR